MNDLNGPTDHFSFAAPEPRDSAAARRSSPLVLLRGRWHWAVLLALLLGAAGMVGGYLYVEPIYRSVGMVRISPDVRPVLHETDVTRQIPHYDSYLDAQVNLMRSRQVIERAVQHEAWQRQGRGMSEAALRVFQRNLEIERSRNSQVAELFFYDRDPAAAAAGVEAAISAFEDVYRQQHAHRDAQIHNQLYERRERLTRELDRLRRRRDAVAGQYGVEGLVRRYQLQLEQLTEVQQLLRSTRVQVQAMREQQADSEAGAVQAPSLERIAEQDPHMREMLDYRERLQSFIARGGQLGLGENHREMSRARVELDTLNQRIEAYASRFDATTLAMQRLRPGPDPMLPMLDVVMSPAELEARERDLARLHEQVREEAAALGERQQEIDDIQERIEQVRADLTETTQRIDRLNLESPLASRLEVISWGDISNTPYNQGQRLQFSVLGGGAGAMLGLGLIMLVGRFDRRVQHIEDAQGNLPPARLLGILPTLPPNLAEPEQVAVAAHCVHHIRTLLQLGMKHQPAGRPGRVMVVTSPSPGSGKTSLTTALGLSFASSETRTLLIDCDIVGAGLSRRLDAVVRPTLTQVLRREQMADDETITEARQFVQATGRPLGEVLVELGRLTSEDLDRAQALCRESSLGLPDVCDGAPLDACIAETGIARMSVLPVGDAKPYEAGMLSPTALRRVFDQARQQFDIVLVDTGPVPGSIEASMAASEADSTIMVVSRGDEKALVLRSLEQLQTIDVQLAGIVFNHAPTGDVNRSSYASAVSGMSGSQPPMPPVRVDDIASTRFGPVGSAVASFAAVGRQTAANATANGHARRTGPR